MSNTTEIVPALINQIREGHELADAFGRSARQNIEELTKYAFQVGAHIHDLDGLTKGQALRILRDALPQMSRERALAYLSTFRIGSKWENFIMDHRQLIMHEVIPKLEQQAMDLGDEPKEKVDNKRFVSWVGKVKGWLQEQTRERPVETWAEDERDVLVATLEPIVEIYNRAKS